MIGIVCPVTNTRLTEIIPGRPHKIADQLWIFLDPFPVVGQIRHHRFGADHHTVRVFLGIGIVAGRGVVKPQNVERLCRAEASTVALSAATHKKHQRTELLCHRVKKG